MRENLKIFFISSRRKAEVVKESRMILVNKKFANKVSAEDLGPELRSP